MSEPRQEEPIDIEAVMEEIRRKVREEFHGLRDEATLADDIQFVMDNCRLDPQPLLDGGTWRPRWLSAWVHRALVNEARRLIDPLLEKQSVWNQKVARTLQSQEIEIERLGRLLAGQAKIPAQDDRSLEQAPPDSSGLPQ